MTLFGVTKYRKTLASAVLVLGVSTYLKFSGSLIADEFLYAAAYGYPAWKRALRVAP